MKKLVIQGLTLALLAIVVIGCAPTAAGSGAATVEDTPAATTSDGPVIEILQHKGTAFGAGVPNWVMASVMTLEENDYPDAYVFKPSRSEANQRSAEVLAQNLNAAQEVAQLISNRIEAKFAGAEVGDGDDVEVYFENVVRSMASAEVSGMRRIDDFWTQTRNTETGETVFNYILLYTIPRETVDELIAEVLDREAPETEEGVRARDLARSALEGGL